MGASSGRLAEWFLRYASPLAGLRRLPVVGAALSWASGKLVPRDALTWVQVQHGPAKGLWLRVNPRTGRDVLEGLSEPKVQEALQRHLRPGMTFYDMGANIGFFTLLAARLVEPAGRVVSFEADPEIASRLRENVTRNEFSNVLVEQKAVWSEPRSVTFERVDAATSPDRGLGHVTAGAAAANMIQVEAVSLDEYTATSRAPDFLKCDVEGAEAEVFRGAGRLLAKKRPGILCEMHSEENRRRLLEEFARLGYACSSLDENHVLAFPQ
jgi:FkbM family methyltransferase